MRLWQRLLGGLAVVITGAVLAPAAMASVSATQSLGQSAGTSAGGSHDLGLNLSFTNSTGDSPKLLTLQLPPSSSSRDGAYTRTAAPASGRGRRRRRTRRARSAPAR
jgi:hypothetical protein